MTFNDMVRKQRDKDAVFPDSDKHELADDLLQFWASFHDVIEVFKERVPDTDADMFIDLMRRCDDTAKAMVDTAHYYINNDE